MSSLTTFGLEVVEVMKKLMSFYKTIGLWDDYTFAYKGLNVMNGSDKTLESLIFYLEEIKAILERLYVERTSRAIDQEVLKLMDSSGNRPTEYNDYLNTNILNQNQNPLLYYYFQPGGFRKDFIPPETPEHPTFPNYQNLDKSNEAFHHNFDVNYAPEYSRPDNRQQIEESKVEEGKSNKENIASNFLDLLPLHNECLKPVGKESKELSTNKTGKEFKCNTCDKEFSSRANLNNHLLSHSGKKMYCCEHCGKLLSSKRNLIAHLTRLHDFNPENAFRCSHNECGKLFSRRCTLETHIATHQGLKPYSCHICQKAFVQKVTRDVHVITHTGNYKFSCDKCQRKFSTRYKLNFHLKSHRIDKDEKSPKQDISTDDKLKCSQCEINFSDKTTLEQKRNYVCTVSDCKGKVKEFAEKHLFNKHNQRHHSGQLTFSCDHCMASFVEKTSLRHHIDRKHNIINPKAFHECLLCGKQFTMKSKLHRHLKIHSEEPRFRCDSCGKRFHRSDALKRHLLSHEETSTSCTTCQKKFKNIKRLTKHISLHLNLEHTCLHCGKTFSSKLALEHHVAKHNGNFKFICRICGKGFVRKCHYDSHFMSHSLFDTFKCSICGKGFKDVRYCKRHIKRSHPEGEPQQISNPVFKDSM